MKSSLHWYCSNSRRQSRRSGASPDYPQSLFVGENMVIMVLFWLLLNIPFLRKSERGLCGAFWGQNSSPNEKQPDQSLNTSGFFIPVFLPLLPSLHQHHREAKVLTRSFLRPWMYLPEFPSYPLPCLVPQGTYSLLPGACRLREIAIRTNESHHPRSLLDF